MLLKGVATPCDAPKSQKNEEKKEKDEKMEKTGNKKEGAAERKLLCPRRFMESRGSNRTFLSSDCRLVEKIAELAGICYCQRNLV